MPQTRHHLAALALTALLCSTTGFASPEAIKLRTQVFQEQEVVGADGVRRVERVPASNLKPGSEVIYEVGYSNDGPKPFQVVITNPLPADLIYQSYAARSVGAQLELSIDGGRTFAALGSQFVRGADGKLRAAQYSDITHVRWKTARAIKPGEAGYVSLRARLR